MAAKFLPKSAAKAIYTHYDLLSSACINNSGVISITEDKKTLEELSAQKILSVLDENLEYRMNSKVRALIDYLEGHFRFRQRHGAIEEIIDDLKEAIEKYNRIYHKEDLRARNRALSEVRDYVGDLFDILQEIIESFYHLVDEDYSLVSDIEEKLHQMHRCSDELGKINEIFKRLTVGRLEEEFQSDDPVINRLLFKSISSKVSEGLNEISVLSDKIVKRIDKLNQEKQVQERNHLIDLFAEVYADRPDFSPNLDSYWIPEKFWVPEQLKLSYMPELTTTNENIPDYYREYAADILNTTPAVTEKKSPEDSPQVKDGRGGRFRLDKTELEKKVDYFMQAVLSDKITTSLSARQGYELLKIKDMQLSLADWIYIVMIGYSELPLESSRRIIMEPVRVDIHPTFSGNLFFSDLIFKKKDSSLKTKPDNN